MSTVNTLQKKPPPGPAGTKKPVPSANKTAPAKPPAVKNAKIASSSASSRRSSAISVKDDRMSRIAERKSAIQTKREKQNKEFQELHEALKIALAEAEKVQGTIDFFKEEEATLKTENQELKGICHLLRTSATIKLQDNVVEQRNKQKVLTTKSELVPGYKCECGGQRLISFAKTRRSKDNYAQPTAAVKKGECQHCLKKKHDRLKALNNDFQNLTVNRNGLANSKNSSRAASRNNLNVAKNPPTTVDKKQAKVGGKTVK